MVFENRTNVSSICNTLFFITLATTTSLLDAESVSAWVTVNTMSSGFSRFGRLISRIGELCDIRFELRDDLSALRAANMLLNNQLDVVLGLSSSVSESLDSGAVRVEEPYFSGRHVVVSLRPFDYQNSKSLAGKSVLALRYTASAEALCHDPLVTFVDAPTWNVAFRMLRAERAEILIVHEVVLQLYLSSSEAKASPPVYVADRPYMTVKNLIWFRRGLEELASRVDKALKTLKKTGEYNSILGTGNP